jgi:hypothetical protein
LICPVSLLATQEKRLLQQIWTEKREGKREEATTRNIWARERVNIGKESYQICCRRVGEEHRMEQDDGDGENPHHQAVDADADPCLENQEASQVCLFFPYSSPVPCLFC